jgi:hypothetical protein
MHGGAGNTSCLAKKLTSENKHNGCKLLCHLSSARSRDDSTSASKGRLVEGLLVICAGG